MQEEQDIICHICNDGEYENQLLLCDRCNRGFHTFCLNIRRVPTGSWYCPGCARSMTSVVKPKAAAPKEVKQAYVYIRVSSKGQNDPEYGRVGMDTQNTKILEFCMANNLYVKSTVSEVGSAYHTNTPKLTKLIKKIEPGVPIVVYSSNRFSRNVDDAKKMISAVHKKDSYIWSVMDQTTSKHPDFIGLVQAAENESRTLGQRISAAHQRIKAQGGWVGKKPFGYNKIRVDGVIRLQENRIEQLIMTKIRDLAKVCPITKVFAIAVKKYHRYNWTPTMIHQCIYDSIRNKYKIIPAEPDTGMGAMLEAIDEVEVEDTANVYTVKKLLKIRFSHDVYEIMVKWDGYSECTWENVVSLYEDAADLVEEFLTKSTSSLVPAVRVLLGL